MSTEGMIDKMKLLEENNRFFINDEEGYLQAEITWIEKEGVYVVDHTYVDERLRGQGIAKKLLELVVKKAKENHVKISPMCSYVASQFDQYPELYSEVDVRHDQKNC